MKSRPRRAENRIAEILSDFFEGQGLSAIERIPILGRTGPDLTVNEAGLIVDAKSRQSCPKGTFKAASYTGKARNKIHTAFRLADLEPCLLAQVGSYSPLPYSKMVDDWLKHMDEWTQENAPSGISAIVIHRPQMPYGDAVLILANSDVGRLRSRLVNKHVISGKKMFIRFENGGEMIFHNSVGEEEKIRGGDLDDLVIEDFIQFLTHIKEY